MHNKLILILILFLGACESILEEDISRLGLDYYPARVNTYRIYQVNEVNHFLIGPNEESYQLKEVFVDSTLLSTTEVSYTINRYRRASEDNQWQLDSIWTSNVNTQRITVTENNVTFVKLIFPIMTNTSWEANLYNSRQSNFYRYDEQFMDTTIFEVDYTETIKVIQSDLGDDGLGRDDRIEVYAPEIGLIYKNSLVLEYCQTDCTSEQQVVAGRELEMSLVSYGEME